MIDLPMFSPVSLLFVMYSFYKLGKNKSPIFSTWLYDRSKKFKNMKISGLAIALSRLCARFSFCSIIRLSNPSTVEM